jgi:hydrogenase expression/formation protein HypC
MCLGVPGRVVAIEDSAPEFASALVEFGEVRRPVCIACVPDVRPGEYVIVHAGIAIQRLDAAEAERLLAHLRTMDELDDLAELSRSGP